MNLILHPNLTRMHTLRKLFPADGRCKTFDAAADGFERGEAAEAIALRPLAEAQAGGDSIMAVISGSAVIHKGGGASLRAMRGPAIVMKVAAALKDARMAPSGLGYMEASGLGEPFGDALELGAYEGLFRPGRPSSNPLIMGSLHTHLGHADGASGAASLVKIVLQATQARIPAIVHFRSLNPLATGLHDSRDVKTVDISTFGAGKVALPKLGPGGQSAKDGFRALFPMMSAPHICGATSGEATPSLGASSFGFGGSMAHVIVSSAGATPGRATRELAYGPRVRVPLYPPAPGAGSASSPSPPISAPSVPGEDAQSELACAPLAAHQALAERALATIEARLRVLLRPWMGDRATAVSRGGRLLLPLDESATISRAVARRFSGAAVVLDEGSTISHLAAAVLDSMIKKGAGSLVQEDALVEVLEGFILLLEPIHPEESGSVCADAELETFFECDSQ